MKRKLKKILLRCLAPGLLAAGQMAALGASTNVVTEATGLLKLNIDELMNIEVTSVRKAPERLSEAAAAVTVITGDDVRRSGATTIPDALRLVPGLNVAKLDSHTWAISSRGFNDLYANKLLVLVDGRSVYTPLFSGVYWNLQDTMLEDLDRIEVIRGPGATLWGANAVNGVINIITKTSKDTQGWLISGGAGTEERGFGSLRYGGRINDEVHYRTYLKYASRDDSAVLGGGEAFDASHQIRSGFRLDWEPSQANLFIVQGDIYYGKQKLVFDAVVPPVFPFPFPTEISIPTETKVDGANALGRWTRTFSEDSNLQVQTYFDHTYSEFITASDGNSFSEERNTFDLDAQHRFGLGERQEVIWGLGYRVSADQMGTNYSVTLAPDSRTTHLFTGFLQDEIKIVQERLNLTLGTKLEHNDYTGFEFQPSARLIWTPDERHSVWASVSRAVRTPSRAEDDVRINIFSPAGALPIPVITSVAGGRYFESESLIAYELGYRMKVSEKVSIDAALFYNDYSNLRSAEFVGLNPIPFVVANSAIDNRLEGESYGGEFAATWKPLELWRLRASYSYIDVQLHRLPGSMDIGSETTEGNSPEHSVAVQSSMDLPGKVELDGMLRYVGNLNNPGLAIPGYLSLDVRVGWHPTKNLEFSIVGQNLLDNRHPEFRPTLIKTQAAEVERSIYGKLTWRF